MRILLALVAITTLGMAIVGCAHKSETKPTAMAVDAGPPPAQHYYPPAQ